MSDLHNDALLILQFMVDNGIVAGYERSIREITAAFPEMSDNEFTKSITYLIQSHYVRSLTMGPDGLRCVTADGVSHWEEEKQRMLDLSLDANRLLRYAVISEQTHSAGAEWAQQSLGLSQVEYGRAARELADEGLVKPLHEIGSQYGRECDARYAGITVG